MNQYCDRNFTEDIKYIQEYNIWTLKINDTESKMKANKDYSRHLSTAGLCIHIVRTKLLCSNLKVRVCISYVPCFIV